MVMKAFSRWSHTLPWLGNTRVLVDQIYFTMPHRPCNNCCSQRIGNTNSWLSPISKLALRAITIQRIAEHFGEEIPEVEEMVKKAGTIIQY
jgi:hypothetical protein